MPEMFRLSADIVGLLEARTDEAVAPPSPAEGLTLMSAFLRIKDPERRRAVIDLVKKAGQH